MRSLLVDIYPANLHEEGLEAALGGLLSRLNGRGVKTELEFRTTDRTLPVAATTLLYRSAQEALRNVSAHAAATTVHVGVESVDDTVVLTIADNGRGFTQAELDRRMATGHVGLRALLDLVADAGGTATVHSAIGRGTRLRVTLPVAEELRS